MAIEQTWDDAFEAVPADGDQIKLGPDNIRDLKDAIRSREQIDHEFGTSDGAGADDQTDTGYHKRVTLKKTSLAEAASGYTELAAVGTKVQYFPEGDEAREVVDLDQAQTLTNKTLTSPTINNPDMPGAAIDYTSTSQGTFKGLAAITYRMVNNEAGGDHEPLGGGGSDWEIPDTEGQGGLGTATEVVETNGVFSFATTGYWLILYSGECIDTTGSYFVEVNLRMTTDNSTYSTITKAVTSLSATVSSHVSGHSLVVISDLTNDKIQLQQEALSAAGYTVGSSTFNRTYITFVRLSDIV